MSTSLATGTRQLARRKVLVKRLVCIEDLGDVDILVTDKTGTLTEGRISFTGVLTASPEVSDVEVLTLALLATETDYAEAKLSAAGQNPLDAALWDSAGASAFDPARFERLDLIDFDHQRRRTSVLVREAGGPARLVTKGAPEDVLALCGPTSPSVQAMLNEQFDAGSRVVAVASRPALGMTRISPDDEKDLDLAGFLVFLDRPKANAKGSLDQLATLGISVKIATGDNAKVAQKVCSELGVISGGTLTGADVDVLSDTELAAAAREATIFARVSPEQKARSSPSCAKAAGQWGSWATASMMPWPCTARTSESLWTAPPTSPRTQQMWC